MPLIKAFAKVEDRPTPPEVYNWRTYALASVAAFAAVMIGYDSAFIGTSISLASFKNELGLPTSAAAFAPISANIVTTYQCGAFLGALFGYVTGQLIGRKWGMMSAAAFGVLGAGLTVATTASTGLAPMYAGRTILGFAVGIASSLAPLYISEIAPPAIRGRLVGMYEIGWQVGGIVGFFINYGITQHIGASREQWIIPFYVQLIPAGLYLLSAPILKESPRWLVQKGRRDQALRNLCWIRQLDASHPYLAEEFAEIEAAIEADQKAVGLGFWAPFRHIFRNPALLRRLLIATTLFMFQNGTGINAINYYSPTFFGALGLTGNTSLLTTGIYGVVKTLGALLWAWYLVDQFGRRAILILGALGGGISMIIIGAFNAAKDPANDKSVAGSAGGNMAIAFFYIWTAFYSVSWNGTPWVYCSEVFAAGAVRTVTSMAAAASNWMWNLVISRATPTMFLNMGHSGFGVYLFFGFMQLISIIYLVLLVPETKHVPLEQMDRLWADKHTWTANSRLMRELQAEHANGTAHGQQRASPDRKSSSLDIEEKA